MKKHFIRLSKNTWIQGGFFLTASNLVIGFLNYLFNIFVGRALGPSGLGEISALFAYSIVLSIPMGTLVSLLIQKIGSADDPGQYAATTYRWLLEKIPSWWYIGVIIVIATPFIPRITNLTPVSGYLLPILMTLSFVGAYYTGALQGLHIFFWYSLIAIVSVLIKLLGAIVVLYGTGGLLVVYACILFSSVIGLLANHFVFVNAIKEKTMAKPLGQKRMKDIFKDTQLWNAMMVTAAMALVNNVDIIFVKKFFDAETTGLYSVWSLFAKVIFYLLSPLVTMAYIFFSSKKHELIHQIALIVSFLLLVIAGVIANLLYGAFGMQLVRVLFGAKFTSIVPFLEWSSYFGIGYTLMAFLMYYFLAKKSRLAALPMALFPLLVLSLFIGGTGIEQVMYICTIYTYANISIFLAAFFWERFKYLIS